MPHGSTGYRRAHDIRAAQLDLPLERAGPVIVPLAVRPGPRAIEDEIFPFEALSDIAEVESWRKEINRALYHIHKWWAQRLGLPVPHICLLNFTAPLRYSARHGGSESSRALPARQSRSTSRCAQQCGIAGGHELGTARRSRL